MTGLPSVTLAPLRWRDAWFCWRLARDPVARANSFDPRPPTPWGHLRWMRSWLWTPTRCAWVAWFSGQKVGVVTVRENAAKHAEIGVNVDAAWRGIGLGASMIWWATHATFRVWTVTGVVARIKPSNVASIKAFARAGYEVLYDGTDEVSMVARRS